MADEYDIFIADSTCPEAEAIFQASIKLLAEIKEDCFLVLDTNALVVSTDTPTVGENVFMKIVVR